MIQGAGTTNNWISKNQIYNNLSDGIKIDGGNENKAPPIVTSATPASITGTCYNGDIVEVYLDSPTNYSSVFQGRVFWGTATTTGNTWSLTPSISLSVDDRITATATTSTGNTSSFSNAFLVAPLSLATQPSGNRGIYFDGLSAYANVGSAIPLNDFTISFWIKTSQQGGAGSHWLDGYGIIDADGSVNDYGIGLIDGKIVAGIGNSGEDFSITSNTSVNNNQWYHVAFTRQGNDLQLYINGALDATGSANNITGSLGELPLKFGASNALTTGLFFKGQLDEIKIFNTVRTPTQISADMISTSVSESNLIHYWAFEETSGGIASNPTGNLDANLQGGALRSLRVTNDLDDNNPGSLRWAINDANSDTDKDYIDFSVETEILPLSQQPVTLCAIPCWWMVFQNITV